MHLAIDCMIVGREPSGVERAVVGLVQGLAEARPPDLRVSLVIADDSRLEPPDGMELIRAPRLARSRAGRIIYEQAVLPTLLRSAGVELLHGPAYVLPLGWGGPSVVTIHDTITLTHRQWCKWTNVLHYRKVMTRSATMARRVIVPSEDARRGVVEHLGVEPARVVVAPLGVSGDFRPADPDAVRAAMERHGLHERYLLCVGNLEPRKNLPAVIDSFEAISGLIPHDLVLVGKRGWRCGPILRAMRASPVTDRIKWLGWVPEPDLAALYSGAELLVQWSLHEGFGLAPLEAMACGTPVVVSDGGALPEVAGDAAEVVPLATGPRRLAERLVALIGDDAARGEMTERGLAHAARFTWGAHAQAAVEAYQEACRGG